MESQRHPRLPGLAGALVLLVSVFLPWFSLDSGGHREAWSAWQVFSKIDVGVAFAAVTSAALTFRRVWTAALLRWAVGGLTVVVVAWKVVDPPAYAQIVPLAGAYVAIAAAGTIVAAAILDLRRSTGPAPRSGPPRAGTRLARVAAARPNPAVGWVAGIIALIALAAIDYGSWLQEGGLDQVGYAHAAWIHNDSDGSFGGAFAVLSHLDYRPAARPYIAALHVVFGPQPGGHLAWAVSLAVASSILLYLVLRRLRVPATYALLAAAVMLAFPPADSTRFGTTLSIASWSILLWLGGLLFAFRGIRARGRRGAGWHALAVALYCLSVLSYEIAAGAIGLTVLVYAFYARSWRPALRRWPADLAAVVVPATLIILKNTGHSSQSTAGTVAHARQIWDESQVVMGWALWPFTDVDRKAVALVALVVVLTGALAAAMLPPADAIRRALGRSMFLGVGGIALLAAGYAPFLPAESYYSPLQVGDGNRTNALAAGGYSLVLVCVLSVASLLLCAPLRRPWVSMAVASLAGCVILAGPYADRLQQSKDFRVRAFRLQQQLATTVARNVPAGKGPWTVYAFAVPAYTGPDVPVFNTTWDMPGAVGLVRGDNDVTAFPIAASDVRCEGGRAYIVRYALGTAYSPRLLFIDAMNGATVSVDRASRCRAAVERMHPGPLTADG